MAVHEEQIAAAMAERIVQMVLIIVLIVSFFIFFCLKWLSLFYMDLALRNDRNYRR